MMGDELRRSDLETRFPEWYFWEPRTGGLVYAKRTKCSPVVTRRAEDWTALQDEVIRANAQIEHRDYWQRELAGREREQEQWARRRAREADTSD